MPARYLELQRKSHKKVYKFEALTSRLFRKYEVLILLHIVCDIFAFLFLHLLRLMLKTNPGDVTEPILENSWTEDR